jgi:hypothetical protein
MPHSPLVEETIHSVRADLILSLLGFIDEVALAALFLMRDTAIGDQVCTEGQMFGILGDAV